MKHSIRINGQIQTIACEFGTDILDKNGREIFEGDIVKIEFDDDDDDVCETTAGVVKFVQGSFRVLDEDLTNLLYGCEVSVVD